MTASPWHVLVDLEDATSAGNVGKHVSRLRVRLGTRPPLEIFAPSVRLANRIPNVTHIERGSGAEALSAAAGRAAEVGHLVVLLGPVLPDGAVVRGLLDAFDLDSTAGFAVPRFADEATDELWSIPGGSEGTSTTMSRACLPLLPSHHRAEEHLAACMVVRREVAAGLSWPAREGMSLRAALLTEAMQSRRRGYRTLVFDRLVVPTPLPRHLVYPSLAEAEESALKARFQEIAAMTHVHRDDPCRRFERLASVSRRRRRADRLLVLIDARGIKPLGDGTSEASLPLLEGMVAERPQWEIDLLVGGAAAEYHQLARRLPSVRLLEDLPVRSCAASLRLGPPRHAADVAELHGCALTVAFHVLDAAPGDGGHPLEAAVDDAWDLVATHADALLFSSAFGRDQFGLRHTVEPDVDQVVTHFSMDSEEHRVSVAPGSCGERLAVLGGGCEYPMVEPMMELLSRAFPYRETLALALGKERPAPAETRLAVDVQPAEADRSLMAARLVVVPFVHAASSLAVVKALACGKTVLVHPSPRWRELAEQTRMPGRLVEFTTPAELVEAVGRELHREQLPSLPLGTALGTGRPLRWRDCSRRLIDAVERMVLRADHSRWARRDRALRLARGWSSPDGGLP
jgi:hypothetical protein